MTMKKLFALLIPTLFLLASCSEDETGTNLTSEEASAEIHSIADNATADITKLVEAEGIDGALSLIDLIESSNFDFTARAEEAESVRERIRLISQYFVYGPSNRVASNDFITFEDIKGLYEWNPETQTFDNSASDFFIVRFPTEGSETNNAELKISQLELETITEMYDGITDEYQVPTLIEASLSVDEVVVASLDLTAEWSQDGLPVKAEVTLFLDPFTFTLGFNDSFANTSSLVTSVSVDNEVILGVDLDVEFLTDAKEDPKTIEGYVQYYAMKISGSVDAEGLNNDETGDVNDYINLELLLDDEKIGDIVFEDDIAYVVYLDGTREVLEEILEAAIQELEDAIAEFE